eukprot:sb/3464285/
MYTSEKTKSDEKWRGVFVDLLISILSYESALLRKIASSLFRVICKGLDAETIQLIMDALSSAGEEEEEEEEEAEEDEEEEGEEEGEESENDIASEDEEEEEEDSEDEEDDEEEEEEEESDLEDEEGMVVDPIDDGESEDIEIGDADEEELKKEDERLGPALSTLIQFRKEEKAFKKEKAVKKVKRVQFQVKILDFVEILLEDVGFTPSTMTVVPTLLRLAGKPSLSEGPIHDRILAIFKGLFAIKSEKLTVDFSEAKKSVIPELQKVVLKCPSKKIQQLATQTLFLLCKKHLSNPEPKKKKRKSNAGKTPTKSDDVFSVFQVILQDLLSNKNTKSDKNVIFQVIERFPDVRGDVTSHVTSHLSSDITLFAKMQAIALLQRILSFADAKVLSNSEKILSTVGSLLSTLLAAENPSPHHVRECIKLSQRLHVVSTKVEVTPPSLPGSTSTALEELLSSDLAAKYNDLSSLAKKVISAYSE